MLINWTRVSGFEFLPLLRICLAVGVILFRRGVF